MKIPIIHRFIPKKTSPEKEELVSSLAEHYMSYGFKPEDSFKMARDFWDKNLKKLKEVVKV